MTNTNTTDTAQGAPPFPPITLTEQDWLDFFEEVDATEDEKIEMIRALWSMMLTFVDIAWTRHAAPETSGQVPQLTDVHCRAVVHSKAEREDV